jgi:hypothetical protein
MARKPRTYTSREKAKTSLKNRCNAYSKKKVQNKLYNFCGRLAQYFRAVMQQQGGRYMTFEDIDILKQFLSVIDEHL